MEIIKQRINSETVNIYTIFDTHFGAANQREKEFKELVKIIEKDKNGYWIGGGDFIEAITLNDKRFSPGELQRKYNLRDLNDLPRKQMKEFYNIIKPIRSRCLGLLIGNHEEKYIKYNHFDVYDYLASDLMENHELKMGGNGFILLNMGKSCRRNVKIFCTHGEGVSTSPDDGSVINSLKRLCADKIADIYLAGHVHRLLTSVEDIIDIDSAGNIYYPRKVYGIGGAWLKKYQIGNSGYFESRRGNETPAGYLKLCLSTSNQDHKLEIKPEIHYL